MSVSVPMRMDVLGAHCSRKESPSHTSAAVSREMKWMESLSRLYAPPYSKVSPSWAAPRPASSAASSATLVLSMVTV